jgi:nucleotide-binding universal stress UspA family protein
MTTILVPVDGSPHSVEALKAAIIWGQQMRTCHLHVLTVVTPLTEHMSKYLTAEKIAAFYQDERETAMHAIRPLLTSSGLAYSEVWEAGAVAKIIVEYAQSNKIDHIFMGTRGLGAVSAMLLGSVANKVLGATLIPVTLIKLPEDVQHDTLDFLSQSTLI